MVETTKVQRLDYSKFPPKHPTDLAEAWSAYKSCHEPPGLLVEWFQGRGCGEWTISYGTGLVYNRRHDRREDGQLGSTKTRVGHTRPLSAAACEVLRQHIARIGSPASGWIFPGRADRCMGDSTLKRCFARVCSVAGLKACRHTLRHTMITRGFASGFSSTDVSGVAGNTREIAFQVYRHGLPGGAAAVVEAHARRPGRAA